MTAFALAGARIFDGERFVDGQAVVVDGERIAAVVPAAGLSAEIERRPVEGLLAPGFIDTQVNGGGGVLFNDQRSVAGIAAIGAAHRRFGTTGFLPTLITDTRARMAEAIAAMRAAMEARIPGLLGIHLEGPFINPDRKGAHPPQLIRVMEEEDVRLIVSPGPGRVMVTLAPEKVSLPTITRLAKAGVLISAGHTAASYDTIRAAREAGLKGFTHLFNAMPPLAGRDPGPVGAALDDRQSWCGLIADLQHVSAASLRVAIAAGGWQRMMLVSDAMSSVGSDLRSFDLFGREVTRRDGQLTLADGTLAGSDLDMATAVRNTVTHLRLPLEAALAMASRVPAEFLGLGHELGRVTPGHLANLVLLDDRLGVTETWIDGSPSA